MKVVRQGPKPPPEPRPFLVTCKHCGSLLEVDQEDVLVESFKISGYFFDGTDKCEDLPFVKCGSCQRDLVLPKDYTSYSAIRV